MNRRKFLDWLRIGGTAAAVAPIAATNEHVEKVLTEAALSCGDSDYGKDAAIYGTEMWIQTVEPGEKYISGNGGSFTAMSSPVIKWSKVHDYCSKTET